MFGLVSQSGPLVRYSKPDDGNLRRLSFCLCAPKLSLFRDILPLQPKQYRVNHTYFADGGTSNGATIIPFVDPLAWGCGVDASGQVSGTAVAQTGRVWWQGSECTSTAPVAVLAPYQEP